MVGLVWEKGQSLAAGAALQRRAGVNFNPSWTLEHNGEVV